MRSAAPGRWCASMADLTFDEAVEVAKLCRQELTTKALRDAFTADYARATPRDREAWVSLALFPPLDRDRARWHAVNHIAQWHLRSDVPMPRVLAEWVADRLKGKRALRKQGRKRETARDRLIRLVVQALVDRAYCPRPTRNAEKSMKVDPVLCCAEGGSACDAAGVAFDIERYGTVERVWNKRDKPSPEDASLRDHVSMGVERVFLSYEMSRNT